MIKTKNDLRFYLVEDAKRNGIHGVWSYLFHVLVGNENACAYRYIKCMRKCEYHFNNSRKVYHKLMYCFYKIKLNRLGIRYKISINLNSCGYGLRIKNLCGGGVLLNVNKVGNYCVFNGRVLIGNKGSQEARCTIGDYTEFGPGAKAFGKLSIGSNVYVAPNAVVAKDVPDNCIVGGVPAKIIRVKEDR